MDNYDLWVKYNEFTEGDKKGILQQINKLKYKPLFSVILPVYNIDEKWLRKCIESVRNQLYPYWELCIADDGSNNINTKRTLAEYEEKDKRIKVIYRDNNGHISAASNSALDIAKGEFIALLDQDDELASNALFENAKLLNQHKDADMIYSDEDKIDSNGKRFAPYFKPDWSPDTFLSQMYTCHLGVYRTELVREIGGFRIGYEGSQDWDLVLRLTEKTNKIYHIPKVLYHWRTLPTSTASGPKAKNYAYVSAQKCIQEALDRRGEGGIVKPLRNYPGQFRVHYPLRNQPLISIIIPTKDKPELLETCIKSIFQHTSYQNFEVIIVDNGSVQNSTFRLFSKWQMLYKEKLRVFPLEIPFNWSRLNNKTVRHEAKGDLLLFLNNDIKVNKPNWLEEMASYANRPSIGAVGPKLLFANNTIQHAGVVLGINEVAGHVFKGYSNNSPGYFCRLLMTSNFAAVTGACLMVKRSIFEKVGGFDENYPVALSDIDFCLKLLEQNLYNVVLQDIELYHFESKSRGYEDTPEKRKRFDKEKARLNNKWGSLLQSDPFYNINLTKRDANFSLNTDFVYSKERESEDFKIIPDRIINQHNYVTGFIDEVNVQESKIIVTGWARNPFNDQPPSNVIFLNQKEEVIGVAKCELVRNDVAQHLKNDDMQRSGWMVCLPKRRLQKGGNIIKCYILLDSKAYALKGRINITL
ncbi:glycosyltransferase [Alkalihalobacterium sp. APHAB7]|uniref:glycosyltransferase n=1 Tax=Alkalihalobacterium sp. APHAB7 TaxID=3402081 RepID=UPI003AAEE0C3